MRQPVFAPVKRLGDDQARIQWIAATWKKRGLVYDDPEAAAREYLEEVDRGRIDAKMAAIKAQQS